MNAVSALLQTIRGCRLDYRYPKWRETVFLIQQGIYTDRFCEVLLPEAERDAEAIEKQGNFLGQPPEEDELYREGRPDIELGMAFEADCRVGIRYKDRPRNVLIYGSAGSGKTVTTRGIVHGIDAQNAREAGNSTLLFVTDLKGDNRDLVQTLHGSVLALSLTDNARIGLNGPPDVPPYVWIGYLSLSLAARLGLVVSRTCLAQIITRLLVSLNPGLQTEDIPDTGTMRSLVWPPLAMVLDAMRIKKVLDLYSSKASYGQTLIQMLSGLVQDAGRLFDCSNGLDIGAELLAKNRHCVIDASNTPAYIVHLVNDYFINYLLVSRLFNSYACDHTDVAFIYDESDLLMESDWQAAFQNGLSPINRLNRLGRELGLMSIVSISAPQAASSHIRRNAHYTIGFNLSDFESVSAAVRHQQLDPRCARMISALPPGQCLFRQTQASYSGTFWCQMDMVAPARTTGRINYRAHAHMPATRLADTPAVLHDLSALVAEHDTDAERQQIVQDSTLQRRAMGLLQSAACGHPAAFARLLEPLGRVPYKDQIVMRQFLENQGYAGFEEVRISRRNVLLIDVTAAGFSALGLPVPPQNKGRGAIAHRYFAHSIKVHLEQQGIEALLEWVVPGTSHPVDVAAPTGERGLWRGYEVCVTSTDNLASHVQACFEHSRAVAELVIVMGTQKELGTLKCTLFADQLCARHAGKITFAVIDRFL